MHRADQAGSTDHFALCCVGRARSASKAAGADWIQGARFVFLSRSLIPIRGVKRCSIKSGESTLWKAFDRVEWRWHGRCPPTWRKFLRACAVVLLDRLPKEATDWLAEADRFEQGQLSDQELTLARERALRYHDAGRTSMTEADLNGLWIVMARMWPESEQWDFEAECFIQSCIEAEIDIGLLVQLLHEHFPSAFARRPWWRFW